MKIQLSFWLNLSQFIDVIGLYITVSKKLSQISCLTAKSFQVKKDNILTNLFYDQISLHIIKEESFRLAFPQNKGLGTCVVLSFNPLKHYSHLLIRKGTNICRRIGQAAFNLRNKATVQIFPPFYSCGTGVSKSLGKLHKKT